MIRVSPPSASMAVPAAGRPGLARIGITAAAFVMAGLLWAPASALAQQGVSSDKIVLGQAAPLDGPAAALGLDMKQGLLAAFAEANKTGGVKGRKIELVSRDDGYEPNKSIEATKALILEDKVFAMVGAVGTPTSMATQPIAAEAGLPFVGAFTGAEFCATPPRPMWSMSGPPISRRPRPWSRG
jgi:branched-chain amino acid transport system substrate-binding protein